MELLRRTYTQLQKEWLYAAIVLMVAVSYTMLRFTLNVQYAGANWSSLYNFEAPIPFGYRVLIPILSRPLVYAGASIKQAYMVWEFLSSVLLVVSLYKVFRLHVTVRWAKVLSLALFYVLPLLFLLRTRWPLHTQMPYYLPYDTLAMAFVVLSIYYIIKEKWLALAIVLAVSTLNRESSILILMIFGAVYLDKLSVKKLCLFLVGFASIYLVVRVGVGLAMQDNPRPYNGAMSFYLGGQPRVVSNLRWLIWGNNFPMLLSTLGWLPLYYLKLRSFTPPHMKRLPLVVFVYFSMLMLVGNLFEPRIFGEIISVMYVSMSLALYGYLTGETVQSPLEAMEKKERTFLVSVVDRHGFMITLVFFTLITLLMTSFGTK